MLGVKAALSKSEEERQRLQEPLGSKSLVRHVKKAGGATEDGLGAPSGALVLTCRCSTWCAEEQINGVVSKDVPEAAIAADQEMVIVSRCPPDGV